MKKFALVLITFCIWHITYSQTNTFPTSGNVGIGTTTPGAKLDIQSEDNRNGIFIRRTGGNFSHNLFQDANGYSNYYMYGTSNNVVNVFATNGNSYINGGNVGIGTTNPRTRLSVASSNNVFEINPGTTTTIEAIDLSNTSNSVSTAFYTRNGNFTFNTGSYSERLRISNDGNVGIGTTTPAYKLDIGSSVQPGEINITNDNYNTWIIRKSRSDNSQVAGLKVYDRGEIGLIANGLEGVRINYNGNVGIGTTSPGQLLTLRSADPELSWVDSDGSMTFGARAVYVNGSTADYLQFRNANSGANLMAIRGDGNVGIGTTSPILAKLQIKSTINSSTPVLAFFTEDGTNNPRVIINHTTAANDHYLEFTSNFGSGSGYADFIFSNGNVGIGTTSPVNKLEVLSGASNNEIARFGGTLSARGLRLSSFAVGGTNEVGFNFNAPGTDGIAAISFSTLNSERLRISSNGNVGIGVTNPQYKLTVEGTIAAREVNVTTETWSDFVFHSSYKLRSLGEVEQFIKANSHLPEIPSAAEVKENGIGLGEMNAKLLQKIEELTLYMIEQQKQMVDQQKQLNELKLQNQQLSNKIDDLKK